MPLPQKPSSLQNSLAPLQQFEQSKGLPGFQAKPLLSTILTYVKISPKRFLQWGEEGRSKCPRKDNASTAF